MNKLLVAAGLSGLLVASFLWADFHAFQIDNVGALLLATPLIWLSVVDLEHFEIPDGAVALILFGGLGYRLSIGGLSAGVYLFDAILVFAAMYAFSVLAERWLQKTALGFGDVKLLGASVVWIGALGISSAILLASVAGILFAVMMWLIGNRRIGAPVPFGPFIAIGVWTVWLFGPIL